MIVRPRSRWLLAQLWAVGLVVYAVAIGIATPRIAIWINDLAWTLASLAAALVCRRTARLVDRSSRKAWLLITLGCASWFVGQLHWDFYQLVPGVPIEYPNVGQLFYSSFAACVIA